jgi:hypothetical protein
MAAFEQHATTNPKSIYDMFCCYIKFLSSKKKINTLTAQNQHNISNTEINIVPDNTKYQHCSFQASQNYKK